MQQTKKLRDVMMRIDNVIGNSMSGAITDNEALRAINSMSTEADESISELEDFLRVSSEAYRKLRIAGDGLNYAAMTNDIEFA